MYFKDQNIKSDFFIFGINIIKMSVLAMYVIKIMKFEMKKGIILTLIFHYQSMRYLFLIW